MARVARLELNNPSAGMFQQRSALCGTGSPELAPKAVKLECLPALAGLLMARLLLSGAPMKQSPPALRLALPLCLIAASASLASAQPGATPTTAEPEAVIGANAPTESGIHADPNMGNAWLAPTAFTMPKGKWAFHNHELLVMGASYGLTDRLQLSARMLVPMESEHLLWLALASAKARLVSQGRFHLSVHGSFNHVGETNGATAGGAVSVCIDSNCDSSLNAYAGAGLVREDGRSRWPLLVSGSLIAKLTGRVKLIAEVDAGRTVRGTWADGHIGWFGVRFYNKHLATDLGVVLATDAHDRSAIGLPWVNFTYRN
jgi:hypothetical protein